LCLKGIIVPDEFADGDAVFFDEIEISHETTSLWLGGDCAEHAATDAFFLFDMEYASTCAFLCGILGNLYEPNQSAIQLLLIIFIILLVVDVLLFILVVGTYFVWL
jgi:hypothetical protein